MHELRAAQSRGHANHGWLDSWHSFSFADYHDAAHMGFGPLRVINEDRVAAGAGFGTHGHRDMEIISYVLSGELAHRDSTGGSSVLRPGDVQRMSAGRGVQHSEYNHSPTAPVHFLQIWIQPNVLGIAPEYEERRFDIENSQGKLQLIASPQGEQGSLRIHQDARVWAGRFDAAASETLPLDPQRLYYVQLARGTLNIDDTVLAAGDGLKIRQTEKLTLHRGTAAEALLFDLPASPR